MNYKIHKVVETKPCRTRNAHVSEKEDIHKFGWRRPYSLTWTMITTKTFNGYVIPYGNTKLKISGGKVSW